MSETNISSNDAAVHALFRMETEALAAIVAKAFALTHPLPDTSLSELETLFLRLLNDDIESAAHTEARHSILRMTPDVLEYLAGACSGDGLKPVSDIVSLMSNSGPDGNASSRRRMLADRVRAARGEKGLSQDELANRAGWSRKTVMRLERGLPIASQSLRDILEAVDVEVEDGFLDHDRKASVRVRLVPVAGFEDIDIPFGAVALDLRMPGGSGSPAWNPLHEAWTLRRPSMCRSVATISAQHHLAHLPPVSAQACRDLMTFLVDLAGTTGRLPQDDANIKSLLDCAIANSDTGNAGQLARHKYLLSAHGDETSIFRESRLALASMLYRADVEDTEAPDLTPEPISKHRHLTIIVDLDTPRLDLAAICLFELVGHGLSPRFEIEGPKSLCAALTDIMTTAGLPEPGIITTQSRHSDIAIDGSIAHKTLCRTIRRLVRKHLIAAEQCSSFVVLTPQDLAKFSDDNLDGNGFFVAMTTGLQLRPSMAEVSEVSDPDRLLVLLSSGKPIFLDDGSVEEATAYLREAGYLYPLFSDPYVLSRESMQLSSSGPSLLEAVLGYNSLEAQLVFSTPEDDEEDDPRVRIVSRMLDAYYYAIERNRYHSGTSD